MGEGTDESRLTRRIKQMQILSNWEFKQTALKNNCVAFVGSSKIAYGYADGSLCCADVIAKNFTAGIAKGETAALSSMLFIAWVIVGAIIYATYGYRKNREAEIEVVENEQITTNIQ